MTSGYVSLSETARSRQEPREIANCQVFRSFAHGITRWLNFLSRLGSVSAHCGRSASHNLIRLKALTKIPNRYADCTGECVTCRGRRLSTSLLRTLELLYCSRRLLLYFFYMIAPKLYYVMHGYIQYCLETK